MFQFQQLPLLFYISGSVYVILSHNLPDTLRRNPELAREVGQSFASSMALDELGVAVRLRDVVCRILKHETRVEAGDNRANCVFKRV